MRLIEDETEECCPFCGSRQTIAVDLVDEDDLARVAITCQRCHATGPLGSDASVASVLWDDRAGPDGPADEPGPRRTITVTFGGFGFWLGATAFWLGYQWAAAGFPVPFD